LRRALGVGRGTGGGGERFGWLVRRRGRRSGAFHRRAQVERHEPQQVLVRHFGEQDFAAAFEEIARDTAQLAALDGRTLVAPELCKALAS